MVSIDTYIQWAICRFCSQPSRRTSHRATFLRMRQAGASLWWWQMQTMQRAAPTGAGATPPSLSHTATSSLMKPRYAFLARWLPPHHFTMLELCCTTRDCLLTTATASTLEMVTANSKLLSLDTPAYTLLVIFSHANLKPSKLPLSGNNSCLNFSVVAARIVEPCQMLIVLGACCSSQVHSSSN
jgi:hypothetical protein